MLDDLRIERYARHILLREVGGVGQEKILSAQVRIDGLGEAGCWAATYLAMAGVGLLQLTDTRPVPAGGLLPLLPASAEGTRRDLAAAEAIPALNPDTRLEVPDEDAAKPTPGSIRLAGPGGGTYVLAAEGARAVGGWVDDGQVCLDCIAEAAPVEPDGGAAMAGLVGSIAASEILAAILSGEPRRRGLRSFLLGESAAMPPCRHGVTA